MLRSTNLLGYGLGVTGLSALSSALRSTEKPARPKYHYSDGGVVLHRKRALRTQEEAAFRLAVRRCLVAENREEADRAVRALPQAFGKIVRVTRAVPIVRGKTYPSAGQGFGTSRVARHRRQLAAARQAAAA